MFRLPLLTITATLTATLLFAGCESRPASDADKPADAALFDSVLNSSFSTEADSLAREMARTFGEMTTRTGSTVNGSDTSSWTARIQGENVQVIEERISRPSGSTARVFFFTPTGSLEQLSEQRVQMKADGSVESTQTQIDFADDRARAVRRAGDKELTVSDAEIADLVRHAQSLVEAVRNTAESGN